MRAGMSIPVTAGDSFHDNIRLEQILIADSFSDINIDEFYLNDPFQRYILHQIFLNFEHKNQIYLN